MLRRQFLKGMAVVPLGFVSSRFISEENILPLQKTMHVKFNHSETRFEYSRKIETEKMIKQYKIPFLKIADRR